MSPALQSEPRPPLSELSLTALYDLLRPITLTSTDPRSRFINWGLSFECTPLSVFEPESEYQCELVLELARREGKTVRAAGVGHSPSDLACTSGFMLRTEKLNKIIEVSAFISFFFSLSFSLVSHGNLRSGPAIAAPASCARSRHIITACCIIIVKTIISSTN
jgi:hypothetical protein